MDIEKLIERLKNAGGMEAYFNDRYNGLYHQAADTITELRAELEQVKAERDALKIYFNDLSSKPDCNTCARKYCEYKPRVGQTVRANCPLWRGPRKEMLNDAND